MAKNQWIAYRVYPDGHKQRLTPGGKNVFGDLVRKWLVRRAKILKQGIEVKPFRPTPAPATTVLSPTHFSEHFSKAEFACSDGTPIPKELEGNAHRLALALEHVRRNLGNVPLDLLSVYRTPEHNKAVHGAKGSKHVTAEAADLDVASIMKHGLTHDQILHAVESVPDIHGVGIYPSGAIHADVRSGGRVFWSDWVKQ
jgi:hypothetical protein